MLGRALRRAAHPRNGQAHRRAEARVAPRVDVTRCDASTQVRLQRLATRTGAFTVADLADPAVERAPVVVVMLGTGDGDDGSVSQLRREHRAAPSRRTVVIGHGTTWFDAAFGAGVDAWVDHTADDGTLLAAIVGPCTP